MGKWSILRNSNYRRTVKSILLIKMFMGLVEMMFGLVYANFSLPEWQALKMTSFAPWIGSRLLYAIIRASDRLQKKKSNFTGLLGTKTRKNRPISREFRAIFGANLARKQPVKKRRILWLFLLEIDWFCPDQTGDFNVFLTEVIICSFNNNTPQKWTNSRALNIMASAQFLAT